MSLGTIRALYENTDEDIKTACTLTASFAYGRGRGNQELADAVTGLARALEAHVDTAGPGAVPVPPGHPAIADAENSVRAALRNCRPKR